MTLVAVAALRGVPYPLVKVVPGHAAAPLLMAGIQAAAGAAVPIAVAAGRGKLRGLHGHRGGAAGPFTLLRFGEQRVSPSPVGVLVPTTPLSGGAPAAADGFCERPARPAHGGPPTRRAGRRRRT